MKCMGKVLHVLIVVESLQENVDSMFMSKVSIWAKKNSVPNVTKVSFRKGN